MDTLFPKTFIDFCAYLNIVKNPTVFKINCTAIYWNTVKMHITCKI